MERSLRSIVEKKKKKADPKKHVKYTTIYVKGGIKIYLSIHL